MVMRSLQHRHILCRKGEKEIASNVETKVNTNEMDSREIGADTNHKGITTRDRDTTRDLEATIEGV